MQTKIKTTLALMTVMLVGLTVASVNAQSIRLDIKFTDPQDNGATAIIFGFSAPSDLVDEVNAVFFLNEGRTSDSGRTTYVTSDIHSASVPFGDADYTVMSAFRLEVEADETISTLNWTSAPLSTSTVSNGIIAMNSPLHITGIDIVSGQEFSYTYLTSVETITAVPEPSTAAILVGVALVGAIRRRRSVREFRTANK